MNKENNNEQFGDADNGVFLILNTIYKCPTCQKLHEIHETFTGNSAMWDSGIEIECTCGLTFTLSIDFNE